MTTAVEDDTFWENPGFDLEATVNALATELGGGGDRGGASTITQQLVRSRLLPSEVIEQGLSTQEGLYARKALEMIQAFKLTQAFPGEQGKKSIITAYLNESTTARARGDRRSGPVVLRQEPGSAERRGSRAAGGHPAAPG